MRGFFMGLAVGAGAALAGPSYWRVVRPAAKKAMRAGIEGYIVAQRALARMSEEVEDLIAEVSHEMAQAAAGADAGEADEAVIRADTGAAGESR